MDEYFWQSRWKDGRIAFHDAIPNRHLLAQFHSLQLPPDAHVFVPLCGKTVDLDWLLNQGHRVTGVEFNEGAAWAVFERLGVCPEMTKIRTLTRLKSNRLTIWIGDFFALTADDLGAVDAVYDRAALVALSAKLRTAYAPHLVALSASAPQLVITYVYDQSLMDDPPFSVPETTVRTLYEGTYNIMLKDSRKLNGPMADRTHGSEDIWLFEPRS